MSAWDDFKRGFRDATGGPGWELVGGLFGVAFVIGFIAAILTAALFALKAIL